MLFSFRFFSNQAVASNEKKIEETKKTATSEIELDESSYRRANTNDFFSKAFGPSKAELKPNQPHSLRSAFESAAAGFIQQPAPGTQRETLQTIKEEMRKKKIRLNTKT